MFDKIITWMNSDEGDRALGILQVLVGGGYIAAGLEKIVECAVKRGNKNK